MSVPLVEEEGPCSSWPQPWTTFSLENKYLGFSVLVELLLVETVMKQRRPFNRFIKRLASYSFKVGESVSQDWAGKVNLHPRHYAAQTS